MLQWLYTYVLSVCSDCFICFRRIFVSVSCGYYKSRSRCCIYMYGCKHMLLSVSCYFKRMFQVFHLDIAYILQWLYTCFSCVSNVCCKCFGCFGRLLQVFHLDVAKLDLVLHMLQWDPPAVVHARGMWRGMVAGVRAIPVCVCSGARAWAVPSVTGETK
jgi:hypothetical protein